MASLVDESDGQVSANDDGTLLPVVTRQQLAAGFCHLLLFTVEASSLDGDLVVQKTVQQLICWSSED